MFTLNTTLITQYLWQVFRGVHTAATILGGIPHGLFARLRDGVVAIQINPGTIGQGPLGADVSQSRYAGVADLVSAEIKILRMVHMAHQTRLSDLENVHAKAQGMKPRQWGVSSPATAPARPCRRRRRRP